MWDRILSQFAWWCCVGIFGVLPLIFYPFIKWFPLPLQLFGLDPLMNELFEVPKMLFLYCITGVLTLIWCIDRWHYRTEDPLIKIAWGWPLFLLFSCLVVATVFSIDWYSSIFGFPTRIVGGLLSLGCVGWLAILIRDFNFSQQQKISLTWVIWLTGLGTALYGIAQRIGVGQVVWEQDVQARVFSTIGQPNWLAAYLIGCVLIGVWLIRVNQPVWQRWLIGVGTMVMIVTIGLTGSRAGILGFMVAMLPLLMWCIRWLRTSGQARWWWGLFLLPLGFLFFYRGNYGASETERIRWIVWQGAWEIVSHYPLLGSGLETFALAFYQYRPVALLATTEWDLLYNKAHNEPLHVFATTGLLGFSAYLLLIGWVSLTLWRSGMTKAGDALTQVRSLSLLGIWLGIWVSNLFGFSTVSCLLFYIICFTWTEQSALQRLALVEFRVKKWWLLLVSSAGIVLIGFTVLTTLSELASGRATIAQQRGDMLSVIAAQEQAVYFSPWQPWYAGDLAFTYAFATRVFAQQANSKQIVQYYQDKAEAMIARSTAMAPNNVVIWRKAAASYAELARIDTGLYGERLKMSSERVQVLAPTDVKMQMGLVSYYQLLGETERAGQLRSQLQKLEAVMPHPPK